LASQDKNMVWRIEFSQDLQIVELIITGKISGPELVAAAKARIDSGRRHGVDRFLIDAAEVTASKSTIMDVLEIPEAVYFDKGMDRATCIAVLAPRDPESKWSTEFYENASVLRGWRVRTFEERSTALTWLQNHGA